MGLGSGQHWAAAWLIGLVGTASAAPLGEDLVGNGGFESVNPGVAGPFGSVRVLGPWTDTDEDDLFAYPYTQGYSGANTPPDAGDHHFTGGFGTAAGDTLIEQSIDLTGGDGGEAIGRGAAAFDLSGYFSSYRTQVDSCVVRVIFLDADGDRVGVGRDSEFRVGGLSFVAGLEVVDGQRAWGVDAVRSGVPFGAATAVVRVEAEVAGANHDGYVDLVDLRLVEASVPARVGVNLVGNSGFEAIDAGDVGPFASARVAGAWVDASGDGDDTWVYAYSQGYSGANRPPDAGSHHFSGGFGTAAGEAQIRQEIDLSGGEAETLIASGAARYDLSAYFSSYQTQGDACSVRAVFLDGSGATLGEASVGGAAFLDGVPTPDGQRAWARDAAAGALPAGARRVVIEVVSAVGVTNHDGYVDDVSFRVTSDDALAVIVGPFLQDAEPNSVWVGWETRGDAASVVEYGPTEALGLTATGSSVAGFDGSRIHHAMLSGLEPGTGYWYRVGSGAPLRFRTPPPRGSEGPFRFVAYSDTQWGPDTDKHAEVINEGVIRFTTQHFGARLEDELAFSIIPGDLVDYGPDYGQWKSQFFDEEQNLSQHIPLYPAIGNHEADTHWYFDYFRLPDNGTAGYLEHWWYKDYANVRVIGLDTNGAYRIAAQLEWLDGVLASAAGDEAIDFVFAQFHHPHKSPSWTPGNTDYSGEIVRRLEAFSSATGKPTVHFFGHTHAYERGQSRDHDHLWVDVSAAEGDLAWWGEYPTEDYPEFQKVFMDWGFALVEVEGGENPSFRLRRVSRGNQYDPKDNEVLDDITIRTHNAKPQRPEAQSPPAGSVVSMGAVVLRGSVFIDWDGDGHLATRVQVTTSPGDYGEPLLDEWFRFENWFAPPGATGRDNGWYSVDTRAGMDVRELVPQGLSAGTTYFWRVRYRDTGLAWSDWSEESSFRVRGDGDCMSDLAEPFGVLDLSDIAAFVEAFVGAGPSADLAEPYGVLDLADIAAFAGGFVGGCP